jgi:hypothetical protein
MYVLLEIEIEIEIDKESGERRGRAINGRVGD